MRFSRDAIRSGTAPDGTVREISRGTIQGSRRALEDEHSWRDASGVLIRPWKAHREDEWLEPSSPYAHDMMLFPRLWSIEPGHSLRLTFTTQSTAEDCAALIQTNPCFYTPQQRETLAGGIYELLFGPELDSAISLPLLPHGHFPTRRSGLTPTSGGETMPLDWGATTQQAPTSSGDSAPPSAADEPPLPSTGGGMVVAAVAAVLASAGLRRRRPSGGV